MKYMTIQDMRKQLLLGVQHPLDKGARNIMTQKPNVLNVGISRAKNNLYIIGILEIWLKHKYMPEIYAW